MPRILVPEENRKDLAEVPPQVKRRLEFHFVRNMDEVLEQAMVKRTEKKVAKPKANSRRHAAAVS